MRKKVQYSPDPKIVSIFQTHTFAYSLFEASGKVISTMNRVRGFIESLGVFSPSRRIVTRRYSKKLEVPSSGKLSIHMAIFLPYVSCMWKK